MKNNNFLEQIRIAKVEGLVPSRRAKKWLRGHPHFLGLPFAAVGLVHMIQTSNLLGFVGSGVIFIWCFANVIYYFVRRK